MGDGPGRPATELRLTSPLELLDAAILSAHIKDRQINEVTLVLISRCRGAAQEGVCHAK
jgi:endonuclease III